MDQSIIRRAINGANIDILRLLLADERIIITNELLANVDRCKSNNKNDPLFEAGYPRIWPRVSGNDVA